MPPRAPALPQRVFERTDVSSARESKKQRMCFCAHSLIQAPRAERRDVLPPEERRGRGGRARGQAKPHPYLPTVHASSVPPCTHPVGNANMLVNGHTLAAIMRAVAPPRPPCLGHRLGCRLLLRLVPLSQQQSAVTARHALQVMPTIVAQLRVLDEGPRCSPRFRKSALMRSVPPRFDRAARKTRRALAAFLRL